MIERIDHAAEARRLLADVAPFQSQHLEVDMQSAATHATLAVAEQLRIANLIALGGPTHPKLCEQVSSDAATALTEWRAHESRDRGGWHELRPEIAAALGIEAGENDD